MSNPSVFGEHLQRGAERLRPYEHPERGAPGHSSGLLLPQSEAQLGEFLSTASQARVPLVISAGRTGLVEAQRPEGEVVLSLEKLKHPLQFHATEFEYEFAAGLNSEQAASALAEAWLSAGSPPLSAPTVEVQAGMAVDALNEIIAPLGLMFPMEMGSTASATVGAAVANASAGANAVRYGTAMHMCAAASGFWASGAPAGPCIGQPWQAPGAEQLAIDSSGFDPETGLLGSQGALGVISRVTLRLQPLPATREALLLPVADMPAAMRLLAQARQRFGAAIEEFEFLSDTAVDLVAQHQGAEFRFPLAERNSPFYVLLQVCDVDEGADLISPLYELAAGDLGLADEQIGYAPLAALKHIRHSVTESSNAAMRRRGGGRLSFDTATPVAVFGDYLAALETELRALAPELLLVAFGHAGVGGAHLHVLGSAQQPAAALQEAIVACVFDVTQRYGGTFSAEHGVGPKWAGEFLKRSAPERIARMRAAKQRHDPAGILNPRSFGLL